MKINELDQKPEVIEFLKDYAFDPCGFVVLAGTNGTGKSTAAMAVYEAIAPFKLPAYDHEIAIFITQSDLINMWLKQMKTHGDNSYLVTYFTVPKLLVLDDIGNRSPSEAFIDFIYAIVDKRFTFRHCKGTILTTNLTSKSFREKFGDAIASRALSGKCFLFEGADRRFETP